MSARKYSVKHFEQSRGVDTALYKNLPLPFVLYLFTQRADNWVQIHAVIGVNVCADL